MGAEGAEDREMEHGRPRDGAPLTDEKALGSREHYHGSGIHDFNLATRKLTKTAPANCRP